MKSDRQLSFGKTEVYGAVFFAEACCCLAVRLGFDHFKYIDPILLHRPAHVSCFALEVVAPLFSPAVALRIGDKGRWGRGGTVAPPD